jgi:transglutaminase-like putative cysteine protease
MAIALPALDRWSRLPRDARDTLFLLGVIGWTVLPHAGHLPAWCTVFTFAVLAWRGRLAWVNAPLPSRWLLVAALVLAAGLTWWSHRSLLGREPGITLLVVLMALKTLELRARRDAFVVFFLGFFIVLTHFLYSQSIATAAAMLVSVWGLMTALVLAHMPVGQPSLGQAARLAGRTALLGAPVMALLFVLFPRIGPLWGTPADGLATTGLSNTMKMGSVAEVALDDGVALRVRFEGPAPPPQSLYFRGPVLGRFDGDTWTPMSTFPGAPRMAGLRADGPVLRYEATVEPLRVAFLPTLEATGSAPRLEGDDVRIGVRDDLSWVAARPFADRVRYRAEAAVDFRYGPTREPPRDYVDLPPGRNPRTLEWAAALRRDPRYAQADGATLAAAVMQHIRTGGYGYTLEPGTYDGLDTIDTFWLDRKLGFCEHFAAAFVVVMRALDVPARVVTGYQGADLDAVDGYWVVRQSAAHAWAEYWQQGVGWVRADPTAAVAPGRVAANTRLRAPQGLVASAAAGVGLDPRMLDRLRAVWEAVDNRWNQWVLNYARSSQRDLLRSLGVEAPDWQAVAKLLVGVLSALALAGAAWAWWDHRRIDPWTRQMLRLRMLLRGLDVEAAAHEPPRRLAERVARRWGAAGAPLAELLLELERQRYGRSPRTRPDAAWLRRAATAARTLRAAAAA